MLSLDGQALAEPCIGRLGHSVVSLEVVETTSGYSRVWGTSLYMTVVRRLNGINSQCHISQCTFTVNMVIYL